MKVRAQNREGNKVLLEIEEDFARFEEAVDQALIEAGKEIKIPGFRPGKAPKEMIEKAINRDAVSARAAQNLISELYPKIINEAKIDPVDYPKVEILEQKKNQPFVFKISVEVYPEVKLGKYKGLKAEKKIPAVAEEEVLKVLGNLQGRMARTSPDGKKELLPLDDEFAKKVSRYGTLAELKEELREAMLKDRSAEAEAEVKNKLIAAAEGEAKIDLPAAMAEREIDVMLDELKTSLAQSNLTLEDYLKGIKKEEPALRSELRKSAEIRAKGKVVLKAVAEAEKIQVTEGEIENELKNLAEASGEKAEDLKNRLDEGARKYIRDYLLRRKALDFIVEKAKVEEVKT